MQKFTIFKAVLYFMGTFFSGFAPVLLTAKNGTELLAGGIGCFGASCIGLRGFLDKTFASDPIANPEGVPPNNAQAVRIVTPVPGQ